MIDFDRIKKNIIKDSIISIISNLSKEKNISLFLVGGYIRDQLMKELFNDTSSIVKDYDFVLPKKDSHFILSIEEVLKVKFFRVGKEDMETSTYRITKDDMSIDITFQQGKDIEDDLKRRDFTINAIAFSLRDEAFHFLRGSLEDIKNHIIRLTSDFSIDQDPLRMLRAIRYLCTLNGFKLDPKLREEISIKKELLAKVPKERIKMELDNILTSSQPSIGIRLLYESGLLFVIVPELRGLVELGQNEYHHLPVLAHTLLMIEKIAFAHQWVLSNDKNINLSKDDLLVLYYSALFHDIGKKYTYSIDYKGKIHFFDHESYSSKEAEEIMQRLRFSNWMRIRILRLIQNHMRILNLSRDTKVSALKRLINHMGEDTVLLIIHTLADKEASRGILSIQLDEIIEQNCIRILKLLKEKETISPPPLITGYDVIALGYKEGPKVGEILSFIRDKQIEGEIKTREEALEVLKRDFLPTST